MDGKQQIINMIEEKQHIFADVSDKIWEYAEIRFCVPKSSQLLCDILKKEGFQVENRIAHMDNAFVATYGEGEPVIGILAEFDALTNMSQVCDLVEKRPQIKGENGHACGHNALGAGALAGAVGIKDYLEKNKKTGTIKFFGCPAEESGYGKSFMASEGVFDDVDSMLTWHPMDTTGLWSNSTLAVNQMYFNFKGVSSHAGGAPEQGRSALDAAELMNVGVNFLREHIIDEARIHYAFIDAGGKSANVVQSTASLHYFIRAPKQYQVQEIYERVVKIAQGAALMTESEVEIVWDCACADYIVNKTLGTAMYENLKKVMPIKYTDEEMAYEQKFYDILSDAAKKSLYNKAKAMFPQESEDKIASIAAMPINNEVGPLVFSDRPMTISTDVGDASWIAPTAQMMIGCMPHGVGPHSWQWVATGKSSVVHKGLIAAGKVIAMTAFDIIENPDLVEKAKQEHKKNLAGQVYQSAIPSDVLPR